VGRLSRIFSGSPHPFIHFFRFDPEPAKTVSSCRPLFVGVRFFFFFSDPGILRAAGRPGERIEGPGLPLHLCFFFLGTQSSPTFFPHLLGLSLERWGFTSLARHPLWGGRSPLGCPPFPSRLALSTLHTAFFFCHVPMANLVSQVKKPLQSL